MGLLKESNERLEVVINNEKYVPEVLYKQYLTE